MEDYTVGKLNRLTVNVTRVLQTVLLATVILNILDSSVAILDSSVAILDSIVAILDSSVAILDMKTDYYWGYWIWKLTTTEDIGLQTNWHWGY